MRSLFATFSLGEWRHHPWRSAAAVMAILLGVALAFSVQLINASALDEFSSATRSISGQPDLELRPAQGTFDEVVFARVATLPQVRLASPVLEAQVLARTGDGAPPRNLRLVGVDALALPTIAPALMPIPDRDQGRFARFSVFAPRSAFLNPAAAAAFADAGSLELRVGDAWQAVRVRGRVGAPGNPLAVMDLGALQDLLQRQGRLSRIDLQLAPGTSRADFERTLRALPDWPADLRLVEPGDATERVGNLSRAYRVNLTVLALVALFTGAFLVFSVLSLSVAKRAQQFALLGVLGLGPRERMALVLIESGALGLVGSLLGIGLGTLLAEAGLRLLGGDLGGGYFDGVSPRLQWRLGPALLYGGLGVLAAIGGGLWPARAMARLPEARTLKGLGSLGGPRRGPWLPLAALLAGVLLAAAPPIAGLPLAAYVAVALVLLGGIGVLPWAVAAVYDRLAPRVSGHLFGLLAVERARRMRGQAAVAVSGVVASLSLAVALTVMVGSFRESVSRWLDVVLPADLYLRSADAGAASSAEHAAFTPAFVDAVRRLPGIARVAPLRTRSLLLEPQRPPVMLIARPLAGATGAAGPAAATDRPPSSGTSDDPAALGGLPLIGPTAPVPNGAVAIYVSEAMVTLYGARVGEPFRPLGAALGARAANERFVVAGVWRDYVRQFGAITLDTRDYERLTGDASASDLSAWLAPGAQATAVQQAVRDLAARDPATQGIEIASVGEIRATSLRIFDRSFAVTYWLQAVAIGIGLFGIAASFSAQVLARRKEFGLLAHLGFTRGQVLAVVAGEGAAWTALGALAGLLLGLGVAVILVKVVNPQSFHWTMELLVPWGRLLGLCAAVMAAGTLTAWVAGRAAASRDAVLAVKEDW